MKLSKNVKVKQFPWTILPILSTRTAHAIYPTIYLPKEIYENLQTSKPDIQNITILLHEQTHIDRQSIDGWLVWVLKYSMSKTFRFEEEVQAIKNSMKLYKEYNMTWDTHTSAHYLSSYLYLWCTNYPKAKKRLDEEWVQLNREIETK